MKTIPDYTTLVMSGGGIKGLGGLGALQFLADNHKLAGITKFIGTSVGAIISYLVCIGYTPIEILIMINQKRILEKMSVAFSIVDLINSGGAMNFYIIQSILEEMTTSKIGHFLTLRQLFDEFQKELVCCTYNYDKGICEYLDYKNYPNIPCITALRMSSNLPFLFQPFQYEHAHYLDGAILDNFPLSQLTQTDVAIAINLGYSTKTIKKVTRNRSFNFMNYVFDILFLPIRNIQTFIAQQTKYPPLDLIELPLDVDVLNWNITTSDKFNSFSIGYDTIKKQYQVYYIIPYTLS
jgi:predicted acylesterase/phospholipase RssA